ncbi:Hypothetical protein BCO_0008301 (plasmid) [Borrelia coriaceae ATCC 43381]|uniref:Uncharacterized protein n=1 Tax=Borrelia coriaceae ATCC 43381 TaxID=1408429 RepID=W5SWE6_9SPIR|nr:Hypothetical protein BCO_0008301 [Borrelia coriaceae ATCC 43381]
MLKPDPPYWNDIQKHISIKSTTYEAVKSALLKINGIYNVNITSEAGKANIYVILDDSLTNSRKNQITDSNLKAQIWEALYFTCPVGTVFQGNILIDGMNENNQKIDYKISIGKRKYAYLKSKYKVRLENHIYLNIDSRIREIYTRIKNNNYGDMGISFEYQDFFAPVNEIKGMHCIDVSIAIKNNLNTKINEISKSHFKTNKDIQIKPNEILDLDFTADRLLIDITS